MGTIYISGHKELCGIKSWVLNDGLPSGKTFFPVRHMGVLIHGGYPNSWMVYFIENPQKNCMNLGGRGKLPHIWAITTNLKKKLAILG